MQPYNFYLKDLIYQSEKLSSNHLYSLIKLIEFSYDERTQQFPLLKSDQYSTLATSVKSHEIQENRTYTATKLSDLAIEFASST